MSRIKVILTGGAGFIGSHIADELLKKGYDVFIIDNLNRGNKDNIPLSSTFYQIDIRNKDIEKLFTKIKPDYLIHQAAQMDLRFSVDNPCEDAEHNILGSIKLLECCKKFGVKKVVFASSGGAIYGEQKYFPADERHPLTPLSPYGIAKLAVENYIHYYHAVHKIDYVNLRYGNVYGPRQDSKGEAGVIAVFIEKILNEQQPTINGNGKQTRDFIYVSDVVEANVLALEGNYIGEYNISTCVETSINSIFNITKSNFTNGNEIKEVHVPQIQGEQLRSLLSYNKVKKDLNFEPQVTLADGIKKTTDWFKNKYNK